MAVTIARMQRATPRLSDETVVDVALTAVTLVGSMMVMADGALAVSRARTGTLDAGDVALVAATALPLLAWRRAPLAVFVAVAVANVAVTALVHPLGFPLGPAVALYLLVMSRDKARPWTSTMTAIAAAALAAHVVAASWRESLFPWVELLHTVLLWAAAWFAGERSRLRRVQIAELKREAQRERLLAAAEERARIARDLHDSVGHAINVIVVRAGAARLRHNDDPARSRQALEAIEDLARRTVDDIDRLVVGLRETTSADTLTPIGMRAIPSVIDQHRAAGLDVTVTIVGRERHLPTAVDQAAFRLIQEAFTNSSRYGAGAVTIRLAYAATSLSITVTNKIAKLSVDRSSGGHGLVGMRERVDHLGGTLDIEQSAGCFRLRATLPDRPDSR